ncbi:MAG: thiamine phosphate synthase [Acidobacteriota bacterium]
MSNPANPFLPRGIIYVITDGTCTEENFESSSRKLEILGNRAAEAGADLFQIREKNLSARKLTILTKMIVAAASPSKMQVLVNGRPDVASAAGANGVHLNRESLSVADVKQSFTGLTVGYSAHRFEEIGEARAQGADFVTFSPIFETESKKGYGPPLGLSALKAATDLEPGFPVIALGGVTISKVVEVAEAGSWGVAGISIFDCGDALAGRVAEIGRVFRQ